MTISLRKRARQLRKILLTTLIIGAVVTIGAAALEQPLAVLSSNLNSSVGTVLTSDEIFSAAQALARAKAEAEKKTQTPAASTNTITSTSSSSASAVDPEAHGSASSHSHVNNAPHTQYDDLMATQVISRPVQYSDAFEATDSVKLGATALGNYTLTFYCPCEICNGRSDGKTASGTIMTEGRTIAVDSSIIPLGSRVYIEGYGVFIAEDTGSAIKSTKIDICVSTHEKAYDLGVQYADVYLLA